MGPGPPQADAARRGKRRNLRVLALGPLALVAAWSVMSATPASAHAFLVDTLPQAGSRLGAPPSSIAFLFSEGIIPASARIEVEASSGAPVSLDPARVSHGATRLEAGLPYLDRGVYVVNWQATSAVDGHVEAGEFAFGVRTRGAEGAIPDEIGELSWPGVVSSWVFLLGLPIAIGGLVSERAIWQHVTSGSLTVEAPVVVASAIAAIAAIAQLLSLVATSDLSLGPVLAARSGYLTLAEAAAAGIAAVVATTRWRQWSLVALLAAGVAAAYRGHSGAGGWWEAPVNALHVALAGMWLGALAHLVMVLWRRRADLRELVAPAARRYAALAIWSVPLLLIAGLLTALGEIEIGELTSTPYGRVLLIKLSLVTCALLLALAGRRSLGGKPPRLRLLRRLTSFEFGILVAIVIVTGVLVNTAPPRSAATTGRLLGPDPVSRSAIKLAQRAGYLSVYLSADKDLLRLEILGFERRPQAVDLELSGRGPDGRELELHPRTCGPGCFGMDFAWQRGITELAASISHPEWEGGKVEFSVPWPPRSAPPALLQRVLRLIRAQPKIELAESVTSVPGPPNPPRFIPTSGEFFAAQELYGAGGVTNLNFLSTSPRSKSVSFFIPGAAMWYRLWVDERGYLQREVIINSGHRIERELHYRFETRKLSEKHR